MENHSMYMPKDLVAGYINAGKEKAQMPVGRMLWLGVMAGMFISGGASAASAASHAVENMGLAKLVAGAVFPVGLMMIILVGGELFTGNCLIAMGVSHKRFGWKSVIRVLSLVWLFNMIGGLIMAALVYFSGQFDYSYGLLGAYTIKVALAKSTLPFGMAFASGVLCNIFVCVAMLMAKAAKDAGGKIWACFFPIMAFVVSGYEHCVANMYYIPAGILAKANPKYVELAMEKYHLTEEALATLNWGNFLWVNEVPVTLGNIVGGMVFVGAILYKIHGKDLGSSC